jgi:CheY-like chemotaxis protein
MGPSVMVVDDDAENCRALSEFLAAEGWEVLSFQSGEAAWSALADQHQKPDVVVADVRMPGLDGVGLLRRIKASFAALPVILVSAFPDDGVWTDGLKAGALDVFPKPIQGPLLVRTLLAAAQSDQETGLPNRP